VRAHILQVEYYPTLRDIRAQLLCAAGYEVTSVLGNDEAMALSPSRMSAIDLVVVGFSTSHSIRAAMVQWFKARHPMIPVIALQFYEWETFVEADATCLSEDPRNLLTTVATILKS
jgi:DNA-binding NtrC family response regulator